MNTNDENKTGTQPSAAIAIQRSPVESSQIAEIGYDAASQTLEIKFRSASAPVYRYSNVTQADYDALASAESKGSHFIRNIKNNPAQFPYAKVS